jgi:hypothetical protein
MVKGVRVTGTALMLVAALAAGACGKSEAEKRAEETRAALEKAAKDAEAAGKSAAAAAGKSADQAATDAAKGLEQFAKGLGGMAGALAGATTKDGKPVEPVSFRELQGIFVPFDGWEMGKATGEKITVPFAYSQAKVKYRKEGQEIEVSVTDSGFNQLMLAPFSLFLTTGYEKETEDGYEKSAKVAGYPGWEEWNGKRKDGEVNAVVNKRFIVKFEGDGLEDTKVLHQLAEASNLTKLASLK